MKGEKKCLMFLACLVHTMSKKDAFDSLYPILFVKSHEVMTATLLLFMEIGGESFGCVGWRAVG